MIIYLLVVYSDYDVEAADKAYRKFSDAMAALVEFNRTKCNRVSMEIHKVDLL